MKAQQDDEYWSGCQEMSSHKLVSSATRDQEERVVVEVEEGAMNCVDIIYDN